VGEIECALSGWHQKSMKDCYQTGTRLVPETGTWNWPVCDHYKIWESSKTKWFVVDEKWLYTVSQKTAW